MLVEREGDGDRGELEQAREGQAGGAGADDGDGGGHGCAGGEDVGFTVGDGGENGLGCEHCRD